MGELHVSFFCITVDVVMNLLKFKQQCWNFAIQQTQLSCCHCSDTLCDMGAVEQLVGLLSMEHRPFHEQLIVALYHLVTDNEHARVECHRPEFALKSLLLDRKRSLEGKEEFQVCIHLFSFL